MPLAYDKIWPFAHGTSVAIAPSSSLRSERITDESVEKPHFNSIIDV